MTTPTSGATTKRPTHHITLSDGTNTVGLMLADGRARDNPIGIRRAPYPRTSTKISQGGGKYADYEPPYAAVVQENWSGGRASLDLDADTSRFLDSYRAWTDTDKRIVLGGQETFCTGHREIIQFIPGGTTAVARTAMSRFYWKAIYGTTAYYAGSFTTDADGSIAGSAQIWVRLVGSAATAGSLYVKLYSDVTGSPGVARETWGPITLSDTQSVVREVTGATDILSNSTTYWFVIIASGTPDASNHYEVGYGTDSGQTATVAKKSADGITWATDGADTVLFFRIIDTATKHGKYFEYKGALYYVELQDESGGVSYIFLNGDRGVPTTVSGSVMTDSAKTWVVDEWIGCVLVCYSGTGTNVERQSWLITDNTATTITVSTATPLTNKMAAATSEYIIVGSDKWQNWGDIGTTETLCDVAVAGEYVYFATAGPNNVLYRYNERNVSGTWTKSEAAETFGASRLLSIYTPEGYMLYGAQNENAKLGTDVWSARVPPHYGATAALYKKISVLEPCVEPWDQLSVTNVTPSQIYGDMQISVAAGFTTGILASKQIAPSDLTQGDRIAMLIKSSVAAAAGNIKIGLDNTNYLGYNLTPDSLLKRSASESPTVWSFSTYFEPSLSVLFSNADTAYYRLDNLAAPHAYTSAYGFQRVLLDADCWYVGYDMRFSGMHVTLGTNKNSNAQTMDVLYFDGDGWTAVDSLTDGTIAVAGKTLSGSGAMTHTINGRWGRGTPSSATTEFAALDQDLFWLKLSPTGDLTVVDFSYLLLTGNGAAKELEDRHIGSRANMHDDGTGNNDYFYVRTGLADRLYIASDHPFTTIHTTVWGANTSGAATLRVYIFNGTSWINTTVSSDGTAVGGAPMAQTGDIVFAYSPYVWVPGTGNGEGGIGDELALFTNYQNKYFAYITTSAAADDMEMYIANIACEGPDTTNWDNLTNAKDGDAGTYITPYITANDYLYVMADRKFNKVYVNVGTVNAIASTLTGQYWDGYQWASLTITDGTASGGATLAADGAVSFTMPYNWEKVGVEGTEGYAVRLKSSANLTQTMTILEVYCQVDDAVWLDVPALVADTWAWVEIDITPLKNPNPDYTAITCLAFKMNADLGAQTIRVHGGILLVRKYGDYTRLPADEQIVGLEAYGEGKENCWVFTDSRAWELQFDNDNAPVPIPLRELQSMRRYNNGQAHTVQDVYIVFSMGERIERYYQRNLDDIGPDRDEGLPENRKGDVTTLTSYPGRVFAGIDAGSAGYSSILVRKDSGWHEMYRAPYGVSIHDTFVQPVEGKITRLWINQGSDLLWIPLPTASWNPYQDSDFRYTHESTVTTGWISVDFLDVEKLFKSVKLFTEDLVAGHQYVTCEYQEETGELESGWTYISSTFTTSPFQEIDIATSYNVVARRIRFRLHLYTDDNTKTPIVRAMVLEALLRMPVKFSYSATVRLEDFPQDLIGGQDMTTRIEAVTAILDAWGDAPTALTMRCSYSPFDNKSVVLEPVPMNPNQLNPDGQVEIHIGEITLLEI